MKKTVFAIVGGLVVAIALMLGVFSTLEAKPSNEQVVTQNVVKKDMLLIQKPDLTTVSYNISQIMFDLEASVLYEVENPEEDEEESAVLGDEESQDAQGATTTTPSKLPYYIKVNRLANCVTVYTLDEEGNYTVPVKAMVCSVGTNNSTPLGVTKISNKYTWRLLFGNTYGHYSVRFNGHILFHSVPYLTQSNDNLKGGQFNLLGSPASQGCIRLCVADAKWIYDNCAKGTVVEVYDSENPGPLGKPSMPKISENSPYKGWDPTDPNPANPWKTGSVAIHGATDQTISVGQSIDLSSGVSALDVDGLPLTVYVQGSVDSNVPGSYSVTYSATGVLGNKAEQTVTITVIGDSSGAESETPETETPGTETPGTETPGTETPGTETPGTETPGTETPGTETPGAETPGTETPGTETPGTETQEIEVSTEEIN